MIRRLARMAGRHPFTAVAISAALVLAFPAIAYAHHLPLFGPLFADTTVRIQVTEGFPGGNYLARIDSARSEWNSVGTTRPLTRDANRIPNFNPGSACPATSGTVTMHWRETGALGYPNALGLTWNCVFNQGRDRWSGNVAIDTDRDWYTGTGDANDGAFGQCVPSCQDDLWSVLSHELGHGMAFNHFSEEDAVCPNDSFRHTMCPSIYGGSERQRTFEIHEEETFHIHY